MANANKARHAFGNSSKISEALANGLIDAYDILFLDGDTNPKIGWIDSRGEVRIVEEDDEVVIIEGSLPESGEAGKIYVHDDDAFIWKDGAFVNLCKPTDVSALESQIDELETEMETKVTSETVQTMIDDVFQVIEF